MSFPAADEGVPDISVSIVSYNTRDLLRACLASLRARHQEGEVSLEIIVADNGSTDGSVAMVKAEYPEVRVVDTGGNIGYGRANNAALEHARGRYFFILNSDTEAEPGALGHMRDFLDSHPQAGGAGARLILPDGSTQPSCARDPTLLSVFWEQTYLYKAMPNNKITGGYTMTWWDYNSPLSVEQVCGACLLVRRELYRRIGGFDPHYFMYFEDTDFCVRLRKTGAEIWFLPDAHIQHKLGGSSAGDWETRARMISSYNKSRYYYYTQTEGRLRGLFLKAIVLLGASLRAGAWTILTIARRPGANEQRLLFGSVWLQTWRMTANGDAPAPSLPSTPSAMAPTCISQ